MATTLQKSKLSVDLGNVVANSISAVKTIRKSNQARKEAEFQRAIANGLSYEDQVAMRQAQLEEERGSSIPDPDFVTTLETSIANTKKLSRFNKYRTRYAESLGELSSGKINEEDYLSTLKNQLDNVVDPELRLEIQGDITAAEGKVKTYRDTILSNQVKKAKYDGTRVAIGDAISRVGTARAKALISGNQDEVTAYDETLSALQSQMSGIQIQDSITNFQVRSSTRGTNPVEKLNYINSEMQNSDPSTPIKVGDRTYASAQQFWSSERDGFLAGSSQVFGNFFDELGKETRTRIDSNAAKFGYPTQNVLDDTMRTFNELRAKPEIAPFINRLDGTQTDIMTNAVDTLAKKINSVGTNNLTFKEADVQLQNIATKYGVDVSNYRLQLDESLRNLARGGVIEKAEAANLAPDVSVPLPKIGDIPSTPATPAAAPVPTPVTPATVPTADPRNQAIQKLKDLGYSAPDESEIQAAMKKSEAPSVPGVRVPTTTPTQAPVTPTVPAPVTTQPAQTRVVVAGDNLTNISKETGIPLPTILELNPQYKQNPNLIKPGESIKLK